MLSRFFVRLFVGPRIACSLQVWLCAVLGCGLVGGCLVTSEATFPEEVQVPPVVVDTPELWSGAIVEVDQTMDVNELRLGITVRDENVNDDLEVRARLSVLGNGYKDLCPLPTLFAVGEPQRPQYPLIVNPMELQRGACTQLEVWVSSRFAFPCGDPTRFSVEFTEDDVAHATYWIWEVSGSPSTNPAAAQGIVTSCLTVPRAPATMPAMPTEP